MLPGPGPGPVRCMTRERYVILKAALHSRLLLTSLLLHVHVRTCIDKSMQIVLERGFIDKPLTFNIGLLQLIFHTSVFT